MSNLHQSVSRRQHEEIVPKSIPDILCFLLKSLSKQSSKLILYLFPVNIICIVNQFGNGNQLLTSTILIFSQQFQPLVQLSSSLL